jgi:hypothetical protein
MKLKACTGKMLLYTHVTQSRTPTVAAKCMDGIAAK